MPLVTVKLLEGRTMEQKRGMVRDITDAIVKNTGCPPDAVKIDIWEMKRENYAEGGKMWLDSH